MPTSAESIGVVAAANGEVFARSAGGVRSLEAGSPIYQGEELVTGPDSNLEIRFADDTLMSQGGDAVISLDDYAFDPTGAEDPSLMFKMAQGTFRMVTGKIAEQNPERFKLGSPLTTIGIRGTITVHDITPGGGEKHGVEEIHSGKAMILQGLDGSVRMVSAPRSLVDVSSTGLLSSVRPMSMQELSSFRDIAPAAIRQEQEIRQEREERQNDDDQQDDQQGDDSNESGDGSEAGQTTEDPGGGDVGPREGVAEGDGLGSVLQTGTGVIESGGILADQRDFDGTILSQPPEQSDQPEIEVTDPSGDGNSDPVGDGDTSSDGDDEILDLLDGTTQESTSSTSSNSDTTETTSSTSEGIFTGTSGDDNLEGTSASETFYGYDGNDTISALGGNDLLEGGDGNDSLLGGDGNDTILGGDSDDYINGGEGADTLDGGSGNDVFYYESAENVDGENIVDFVSGEDSIDFSSVNFSASAVFYSFAESYQGTLTGLDSNPTFIYDIDGNLWYDHNGGDSGGKLLVTNVSGDPVKAGDITVDGSTISAAVPLDLSFTGDEIANTIVGGIGNDTILGEGGDDSLSGYYGNDTISGGVGADSISGGAGNDTLIGGDGADSITGGDGFDFISYSDYFSSVTVDLSDGTASANGSKDTFSLIEGVIGGEGSDTLIGDDNGNVFRPGDGDDSITGGTSSDDVLDYSLQSTAVNISLDAGTAFYSDFTDTFSGIENVIGSIGGDIITGNSSDNILDGGDGVDTIKGGAGADTLWGGAGSDTLYGETGADTFYYHSTSELTDSSDRIKDFCHNDEDQFLFDIEGGFSFTNGLQFATVTDAGGYGVDTLSGGETGEYFIWDAVNSTLIYDPDVQTDGDSIEVAKVDGDSVTIDDIVLSGTV